MIDPNKKLSEDKRVCFLREHLEPTVEIYLNEEANYCELLEQTIDFCTHILKMDLEQADRVYDNILNFGNCVRYINKDGEEVIEYIKDGGGNCLAELLMHGK